MRDDRRVSGTGLNELVGNRPTEVHDGSSISQSGLTSRGTKHHPIRADLDRNSLRRKAADDYEGPLVGVARLDRVGA